MPAPISEAPPLEEPPTLTRDTESTHGQPPTESLEDQPTLRASIPFDPSVSDMLDAFCAGIGTNDLNKIILDEKIDDFESVLMPSTSAIGLSRLSHPSQYRSYHIQAYMILYYLLCPQKSPTFLLKH